MRKRLTLLLIPVLLLCGCAGPQSNTESVYFYYYNVSALYDNTEDVIYAQPIYADMNAMALKDIVSKYLQGTASENMDIPFAAGTTVIEIKEATDALTVILSGECSGVQQLELTLAGSCLARTLFQFTQVQSITVQSEDGFSYAENDLTFTRSNILTADDLIPVD